MARRVAPLLVILIAVGIAVGLLVTVGTGVASAQTTTTTTTTNNSTLNDTAPYYDNETPVGNNSGWYPNGSNVTLDVLGQMSSRLGSFVIGTGEQIPGGTTYAGTILTGLVMVAIFLGSVTYTSIGSTGGIVVASTIGYGMSSLGLAPPWLKIVLLMVVGTVAAIAALRVTK